jgi:phage replication O-like protein O
VSEVPQLENGYLRIANELYEKIVLFPFSKRELLIVLAVIRKTYGYGKKRDDISLSQLHDLTNLDTAHISRALNDLVKRKVLLKQQGQYAHVLELNKKYNEWKLLPKEQRVLPKQQPIAETAIEGLPKQQEKGCQNSNLAIAETATTKDNSKRQLQKTIPKDSSSGQTAPTWKAYKDAYFIRYGVDPIRNAKVNGQIAQFIKRVPVNEAPHIASHYVKQNGFYADRMHPVDFMLKDAEKLRTEWATGKTAGRKDGYAEFLQDPARGAI